MYQVISLVEQSNVSARPSTVKETVKKSKAWRSDLSESGNKCWHASELKTHIPRPPSETEQKVQPVAQCQLAEQRERVSQTVEGRFEGRDARCDVTASRHVHVGSIMATTAVECVWVGLVVDIEGFADHVCDDFRALVLVRGR